MMKKFYILNIILFICLIFVGGAVLLFAPRPEFSETEKRELKSFPEFTWESLFSGDFTRGVGLCFSDTVPFRENVTEVSARLKNTMGLPLGDVILHKVVLPENNHNIEKPAAPVPSESISGIINENENEHEYDYNYDYDNVIENIKKSVSSLPEQELIPQAESIPSEDGKADIGNNGILVYKNRGLMLYGGSREMGSRYAAALNGYTNRLDDKVRIYNMLIPTSVEFYCPEGYRNLSGNQREDINYISSLLDNKITAINVYTVLSEKKEEDIYLRTDHHWSPLGAFYAAEAFCKEAGVGFPSVGDYEKAVIPGYVGTLYGYSGDINLKNNPEDFIYYKPTNKYTTTYYNYDNPSEAVLSSLFLEQSVGMSYCIFMGGDAKITYIETDVNNGRVLAVFKDSYGNALVPFLINSFEEIYVIDIRYFPYNAVDYIKEANVTDLLFCNNIFAANTGSMIGYIETIMSQ